MIALHRALGLVLGMVVAAVLAVIASPWAAGLGVAAFALYYFVATRRYRRRRRLVREPVSESLRSALEAKVEFYRRLPANAQRRFEDDVRIFLSEQRIVGAHGAVVDDETRVLIAASAAMLGHGLPDWDWPTLRDIVVYPRAFDDAYRPGPGGNVAGMVHAQGPIILSQRELRHGFSRPHDEHNVALHELAHVIDFVDGRADGVPGDVDFVATAPWVEMVAERLARMRKKRGVKPLRDYAGTNEAELFAVAVEAFFERPRELRDRDPELYEMLAEYFAQDPAEIA